MAIETKHCNTCNTDKPLDEFYKQKGGFQGRRAQCKDCYRDYMDTPVETLRCSSCGKARSRRSKLCSECAAAKAREDRANNPTLAEWHRERIRTWRNSKKGDGQAKEA